MKNYPHKPNEKLLATIREETNVHYQSRLAKVASAEKEKRAIFFQIRAQEAMDLAGLEYAFDAPLDKVRKLLLESCVFAEKTINLGYIPNPALYMMYLSLANLFQNKKFKELLENFNRHQFTNENIKADEIFYLGAETMNYISAGNLSLAAKTIDAAMIRLGDISIYRYAKEAMEAIILFQQAILKKDSSALIKAINARYEEYKNSYSHSDVKNSPSALIDILGLGLLKLAQTNGLEIETKLVYLPIELLE